MPAPRARRSARASAAVAAATLVVATGCASSPTATVTNATTNAASNAVSNAATAGATPSAAPSTGASITSASVAAPTTSATPAIPTTTAAATTTAPGAVPASVPAPAGTAANATAPTTMVNPPLLAGLAADAAGLGRQLTDALHTVLDPASPAGAVEAAGQRHQFVVRRLAAHQDWQAEALTAVAQDVREIAANDLAAINAPGNAALAKPVPPKPTLPAWRIRAPLPADELKADYDEASAASGIEWVYLAAINLVETRMGRIVGLSPDGAVGPMQFMPTTWAACCTGDPTVDHDAIMGAARYLVRRGGPGDMRRAILGYNPNNAYLEMIERYAANLRAHPELLASYHAWQVFYGTTEGPVRLPVGYDQPDGIEAAAYLAGHPQDAA